MIAGGNNILNIGRIAASSMMQAPDNFDIPRDGMGAGQLRRNAALAIKEAESNKEYHEADAYARAHSWKAIGVKLQRLFMTKLINALLQKGNNPLKDVLQRFEQNNLKIMTDNRGRVFIGGGSVVTSTQSYAMLGRIWDTLIYKYAPGSSSSAAPSADAPKFRPMPQQTPSRPTSVGVETLGTINDYARRILEGALLKAMQEVHGKELYGTRNDAVTALRDARLKWKTIDGREQLPSDIKSVFVQELARSYQRNRGVLRRVFPDGMITPQVAEKVYNTLVYPKGVAPGLSGAAVAMQASPSTPTGTPKPAPARGTLAPGDSGTNEGGTMSKITGSIVTGVRETCGNDYPKQLLETQNKPFAEKVCSVKDSDKGILDEIRKHPWRQLPAVLREDFESRRVTEQSYAAWQGGAPAKTEESEPAKTAEKSPEKSKEAAKAEARRRIDLNAGIMLGQQCSGVDDKAAYPGEKAACLNKGKLGFGGDITALFLRAGKSAVLGAFLTLGGGKHERISTGTNTSVDGGSWLGWGAGLVGEYALPYNFAVGAGLGFGQTRFKNSYWGKGGSGMKGDTIDFLLRAYIAYRYPIFGGKSFGVDLVVKAGYEGAFGLDGAFNRTFQAKDALDLAVERKNGRHMFNGMVGVGVRF